MYFDTSVLIDYWMTEWLDASEDIPQESLEKVSGPTELPLHRVIRDILHADERIRKVIEIKRRLSSGEARASAVITALGVIELAKWQATTAVRQIGAEASGIFAVQRMGDKEVGDLLKDAVERMKVERENLLPRREQGDPDAARTTGLEMLIQGAMIIPSFATVHGFQGLLQVDLKNFDIPFVQGWRLPYLLSFYQMGAADVFHVLAAEHLGCQYIASFDSDFKRVEDLITKETGLSVLKSADMILEVI